MNHFTLKEMAKSIKVENLHNYLCKHGWTITPSKKPEIVRFKAPLNDDIEPFTMLVPNDSSLYDYEEMIIKVLCILEELEGRSINDIVAQVLMPCDVFSAKIASNKVNEGSIPINECLQLINGVKELMIYSACTEISKSTYHSRKLKEAVKMVENCRFGQTDIGSFITTFYFPLPKKEQLDLGIVPISPIERRITTRIMQGLQHIVQATNENNYRIISENYETGLNANMCEAISTVFEAFPGGKFYFSTDFDPLWDVTPELKTGVIEIKTDAYVLVDKALDELQPPSPPQKVIIEGFVVQLHHNADNENNDDFRVWILWNDKGTLKKVEMTLKQNEYRIACDAHKDEFLVQVEGCIERIGRKWILTNPNEFRIRQE